MVKRDIELQNRTIAVQNRTIALQNRTIAVQNRTTTRIVKRDIELQNRTIEVQNKTLRMVKRDIESIDEIASKKTTSKKTTGKKTSGGKVVVHPSTCTSTSTCLKQGYYDTANGQQCMLIQSYCDNQPQPNGCTLSSNNKGVFIPALNGDPNVCACQNPKYSTVEIPNTNSVIPVRSVMVSRCALPPTTTTSKKGTTKKTSAKTGKTSK